MTWFCITHLSRNLFPTDDAHSSGSGLNWIISYSIHIERDWKGNGSRRDRENWRNCNHFHGGTQKWTSSAAREWKTSIRVQPVRDKIIVNFFVEKKIYEEWERDGRFWKYLCISVIRVCVVCYLLPAFLNTFHIYFLFYLIFFFFSLSFQFDLKHHVDLKNEWKLMKLRPYICTYMNTHIWCDVFINLYNITRIYQCSMPSHIFQLY